MHSRYAITIVLYMNRCSAQQGAKRIKKEYQENLILFLFMLDISVQITCHPPSSSSSQQERRGRREMYQQQRC